jgi:hypothetical protein
MNLKSKDFFLILGGKSFVTVSGITFLNWMFILSNILSTLQPDGYDIIENGFTLPNPTLSSLLFHWTCVFSQGDAVDPSDSVKRGLRFPDTEASQSTR